MFTPPPSPLPTRTAFVEPPSASTSLLTKPESPKGKEVAVDSPPRQGADAVKRRTGRRFRLAVISVPLAVIIFTLCAHYLVREKESALIPSSPLTWHGWIDDPLVRSRMHKRHPMPNPQGSSSAPPSLSLSANLTAKTGSTSPTPTTSVADQPVPVIPSTAPPLPTPFPQSFDGVLPQNFSSSSCSSFFSNMTSTPAFRTCRPFSLLLQSSSAFIDAQTNLTLMNSIIWGTCHTNTAYDQCKGNMSWFANTLQGSCTQELKDRNSMAVNTLIALQAFEVMHDVGCLQDPTSNTYCYLNAVRASNPADSYYFSLPLALSLPKTINPSCSACSKSIMGIYSSALKSGAVLTGLRATYESSAAVCRQNCGADFAQVGLVAGAAMRMCEPRTLLGLVGAFVVGFSALIQWL